MRRQSGRGDFHGDPDQPLLIRRFLPGTLAFLMSLSSPSFSHIAISFLSYFCLTWPIIHDQPSDFYRL